MPLVSLVGRIIARDGRLELTDTHIDTQTHTDQVLHAHCMHTEYRLHTEV